MDTHEYQAKSELMEYGVPVQPFGVASSIAEVEEIIEKLNLQQAVIKIQVHAGGRGKAGGVKFAKNRAEIFTLAQQLLGMKIVNNQTGPEGMVAHQIILYAPVNIKKEYYIGAVIDRRNKQATLIASPEGGMEIEEIAARTPEKLISLPIQPDGSLHSYHLLRLAKVMGWPLKGPHQGMDAAQAVAKAFVLTDASLLEINPFVETDEGNFLALDAKLSIDDNALYRQKKLAAFLDPTQLPKQEAAAKKHDLAYISMEGNIGCMVNGAGLAMATMDIIQYHGGAPANFLDVGGGASQEKVAEGFKLILSDVKVKAILVNIFGGIMNCVTLAAGIIAAASQESIPVPLIVRMEGTNVEQGRKMLADSGLNIILANNLTEAAQKAVSAAAFEYRKGK